MTIKELGDIAPQWLREAKTDGENVDIVGGAVIWHGGVWHGGEWRGGVWHCGEWCGGVWRGGVWCDGVWCDGVWRGGEWCDGVWCDGVWRGGEWRGGVWRGGEWCGGEWHGGENRLLLMSARCGIVFGADGYATAYRTTAADGRGRHNRNFVQPEGEYYENDASPAGASTCVSGIHVASAATAWTYFGVDKTAQMWEVRFREKDLLDCDGEKARIRGGIFRKIKCPFYDAE